MPSQTLDPRAIATAYLHARQDEHVVLELRNTNYQIHLTPAGPVEPSPQGRVRGVIRCPGWKLDFVNAGGAYIEPVYGRPRRIQGRVEGALPDGNAVILEVKGTPVVVDLPERWNARTLDAGTPVAVDVRDGSVFTPA